MTAATEQRVWKGAKVLEPFLIPIGELEPFPGNPRRGDVAAIASSLRRFGQVRAILTDAANAKRIVAGHHLVLGAKMEGWTHIAALPNEFESEEEARAYLLADNRTSELGGYDDGLLLEQLRAAQETTLEGTGYTPEYILDLDRRMEEMRAAVSRDQQGPSADLDVAPPPPENPESKAGEIYELGVHRVMCGDSRDPEQLAALLAGELAEVLWTDPPYGVNYVGKTAAALTIQNDDPKGLPELLDGIFAAADKVMAPSARFYIAAPAGPRGTDFRLAIGRVGWSFHEALVWVKNVFVLGHSDYHYQHEDVLYGWKPGEGRPGRGAHDGSRWYGDHAQATVFHVDRPARSELHPNMKPIELIEQHLFNSSRARDPILDVCGGSGSTLLAAERTGRRAFVMELDPAYVDVIRLRYETLLQTPAKRVAAQPERELRLPGITADQEARLLGIDLEILQKELGTESITETVLAACAKLAQQLNQD